MARARNKMSAKAALALKEPGRYSDGGGLYLAIDGKGESQRRRWLYLFQWQGKRREMGLGGFPAVSLADARKARDEAESLVRQGIDPIETRAATRKAKEKAKPTFGEMADLYVQSKQSQWRNEVHRRQWALSFTRYAAQLRPVPIDEIDTAQILNTLKPLWETAQETAYRVRGRIELVIDAAQALGHIPPGTANPARWKGHLSHLLPKRPKVLRGHHAAMPYTDLPAFMAELGQHDAVAARALEFCILTAARTGEVIGARWEEIDMAAKVWTVPASRMKAGIEHRSPLSFSALAVLQNMAETRTGPFIFDNGRNGGSLSSAAMKILLKRIGREDVTVHGFRSAFRDWAGNETNFPREVAEAALAHKVGDEVERAYRRGDALEKRRALMEAWAQYCEPSADSNVLRFTKPGVPG